MDKKFAIFDLDGTLVDSMPFWKNISSEYLNSKGIDPVPTDILERIKPLTVTESAAMFIREFGIEGSPRSVAAEIDELMCQHYRRDIPLKEGVREYLDRLKARGVHMCVASATSEPLIDVCLSRLGVRDYFEFLLSCESVGVGKNEPLVYYTAAARLGAEPSETAVFEDAWYASRTAKEAGFYVCAIYDPVTYSNWELLSELADEALMSWWEAR